MKTERQVLHEQIRSRIGERMLREEPHPGAWAGPWNQVLQVMAEMDKQAELPEPPASLWARVRRWLGHKPHAALLKVGDPVTVKAKVYEILPDGLIYVGVVEGQEIMGIKCNRKDVRGDSL
jgi:hypothetical protein